MISQLMEGKENTSMGTKLITKIRQEVRSLLGRRSTSNIQVKSSKLMTKMTRKRKSSLKYIT